MNASEIIGALGALAHEHRLAAFRLLVERGPAGLNAGKIAERIGLVPSSLTFHLQNLQRAGLITRRREGRQLIYATDFNAIHELLGYLTKNCCAEDGSDCGVACVPIPSAKPGPRKNKAA